MESIRTDFDPGHASDTVVYSSGEVDKKPYFKSKPFFSKEGYDLLIDFVYSRTSKERMRSILNEDFWGITKYSFIVEQDGSLSEIRVERNLYGPWDRMGLDGLVKSSGLWKPATKNGEKVRCKVYFNFKRQIR
jgi:hypothetical protein